MTVGQLLKFIEENNIPEDALVTISDAEGNNPQEVYEPSFMDEAEAESFGEFEGKILHFWGA